MTNVIKSIQSIRDSDDYQYFNYRNNDQLKEYIIDLNQDDKIKIIKYCNIDTFNRFYAFGLWSLEEIADLVHKTERTKFTYISTYFDTVDKFLHKFLNIPFEKIYKLYISFNLIYYIECMDLFEIQDQTWYIEQYIAINDKIQLIRYLSCKSVRQSVVDRIFKEDIKFPEYLTYSRLNELGYFDNIYKRAYYINYIINKKLYFTSNYILNLPGDITIQELIPLIEKKDAFQMIFNDFCYLVNNGYGYPDIMKEYIIEAFENMDYHSICRIRLCVFEIIEYLFNNDILVLLSYSYLLEKMIDITTGLHGVFIKYKKGRIEYNTYTDIMDRVLDNYGLELLCHSVACSKVPNKFKYTYMYTLIKKYPNLINIIIKYLSPSHETYKQNINDLKCIYGDKMFRLMYKSNEYFKLNMIKYLLHNGVKIDFKLLNIVNDKYIIRKYLDNLAILNADIINHISKFFDKNHIPINCSMISL